MIVGTVRITPAPARRVDVLEVLASVRGRLQDQPGCTGCHVYEETEPEPAIVFVERWDSEEALDAHLRSDLYLRVLAAIELSGDPPDIRFEHVSATEGIEVIERARGSARATGNI